MRQCPLKYKECPLKRPLSGRVVCSFEIQVAKAINGQKNGSAEESTLECRYLCDILHRMLVIHAVLLAEIFLGCCGLLLNGRETI